MAGSVNKVILIGNLGVDPEVRSFQNGGRVCNLSVATSENWKDKQTGDRRERTEWHKVAVYQDGAVGYAEQYLRKGSKVYVEGQLETRKWQDQSGNDRYTTEVTVRPFSGNLTGLDSRGGGEGGGSGGNWGGGAAAGGAASGNDYGGGQSSGSGPGGGAFDDDLDDDVPF